MSELNVKVEALSVIVMEQKNIIHELKAENETTKSR